MRRTRKIESRKAFIRWISSMTPFWISGEITNKRAKFIIKLQSALLAGLSGVRKELDEFQRLQIESARIKD